ncbi:MAG: winged helix-turn-helix domain-containing protein, partial [Duncaniella sp.]|nr:winged helix-turn-helix domain-containing protein [Duncaniella sp.]
MNTETIGLMAGAVWAALNEADAVDTKQLKKMAKAKNE